MKTSNQTVKPAVTHMAEMETCVSLNVTTYFWTIDPEELLMEFPQEPPAGRKEGDFTEF